MDSGRSRFGAFSHPAFIVIWAATTCSLTGVAISDTASAWLMTSLSVDPRSISMVQVASSLPMFLFTLPAGALADLVEPRRFLIALESVISVSILLFAAVVHFNLLTPTGLLAATFVLGACWSVAAPAWLSITPLLVPPRDLDSANAANSVGYNVSRAIGPALAGLALSSLGPAAPYWIFGVADLTSVAALVWWRAPRRHATSMRVERLAGAVQTGLRHALRNRDLRSTMMRTAAVYPFACAYTALLPIIARQQLAEGPEFYGVLLGVASVGAVVGSFVLGWMRTWFGPDLVVAVATGGIAAGLVSVRAGARSPVRAMRGLRRRRVLDDRAGRPLCFGAVIAARMGARTRTFDFPDGHLRIGHGRQPAVGTTRKARERADRSVHGRRGRAHHDPLVLALEAPRGAMKGLARFSVRGNELDTARSRRPRTWLIKPISA